MPAIASASVWAHAAAVVTGAIAPASMNGVTRTPWLACAYTRAEPIIAASQTSGEFALTRLSITGCVSRKSSPMPLNAIRAMSTLSCARLGWVTEPMNGLSDQRMWE